MSGLRCEISLRQLNQQDAIYTRKCMNGLQTAKEVPEPLVELAWLLDTSLL